MGLHILFDFSGIQVGGPVMTDASTQVNMSIQEEECEDIIPDDLFCNDPDDDPDYNPLDDLDELYVLQSYVT